MTSIGERIRLARKKKKLTLTDIKNLTGLSTGNLSELENDKFMPSASALIALKKTLDVSIDWILTGEESIEGHLPGIQKAENDEESTHYFIKEAESTTYLLNEDEKELINGYRKLDEEKRRDIKGFIHVCLQNTYSSAHEEQEDSLNVDRGI
ncbi:MAG: transcriptional regulator, family [Clostridia bacterium]|nr:transcriptional regulator, family [Clostridia bacterium]